TLGDSTQKDFRRSDVNYVNVQERGENIHIYIAATGPDSLKGLLRPLASKVRGINGHRNFVIRISPDTLNTDTITLHYRNALLKANMNPSFIVKHVVSHDFRGSPDPMPPIHRRQNQNSNPKNTSVLKDTIVTDAVHINPVHKYEASFPGVRKALLRSILPQILFSFFLTLITTASFVIIFRGLRGQQRLMQVKNDFISNVTHELKTPVATVSVALEALQKFHALDKPELTKEYLNIAQHELSRLSLMTDNILKTSVFENNGVNFNSQKIDVEQLISEVLSSMRLVFEKYRAIVKFDKTGDHFILMGDASHLTNLVYNLLDNALKYSKVPANITIELKGLPGQIVLSVKDEGIGILPEYQKRIFEKFFRVPSGDVHNTKGYGLGLSYVLNVVNNHSGKIDVESTPGKGSIFKIVLPKSPGAAN
ncbi:MAG: hypothetical protein C0490_21810, partial [Marivirga sp.]|nr:hypothetical protein [Marivirga sp.]